MSSAALCESFYTYSEYVYTLPKGTRKTVYPSAILTGGSSQFGYSSAMNVNTIFLGDRLSDFVAVYNKPKGGWIDMTPSAVLTWADGGSGGDGSTRLGDTAALVGNLLLTGVPFYGFNGQSAPGAVVGYEEPASGWATTSQPDLQIIGLLPALDPLTYYFGGSMAASGNVMVVGTPYATVNGANLEGTAYLFALN